MNPKQTDAHVNSRRRPNQNDSADWNAKFREAIKRKIKPKDETKRQEEGRRRKGGEEEKTGERQNYKLKITATTPKISNDIVAEFELTLSIKSLKKNNS